MESGAVRGNMRAAGREKKIGLLNVILVWSEDMKNGCLILTVLVLGFVLFLQAGCQEDTTAEPGPKTPLVIEPNNAVAVTPEAQDPKEEVVPVPPEPEDPVVEVVPVSNDPKAEAVGPKLTFESLVNDFGEIGPSTKNPCEFKFTNTGDKPLKITDVTKACGCTKPTWDRKSFAPGESGVIKVTYSASSTIGKVTKRLTAVSNDKDNKRINLTIKAHIAKKIKITPERLNLVFNKENAGCPTIKVNSVDNRPFAITNIMVPGKCMAIAYDPTVEATEFVLEPNVDMDKLKKNLSGYIQVRMTHPKCRSIRAHYTATPRFKTTLRTLIVREADPNVSTTRIIWVLSNYGEDMEVESVSSSKNSVTLVSKEKVDNRYKLTIKVTPPDPKAKNIMTDTLYINVKGDERLTVTCRFYYQRK
jgi:hypothetical protein